MMLVGGSEDVLPDRVPLRSWRKAKISRGLWPGSVEINWEMLPPSLLPCIRIVLEFSV